MKIQINCSEKHAEVMIKALDFYSRILAGQFHELSAIGIKDFEGNDLPKYFFNIVEHNARGIFNGAYHGICSPNLSENAKIAYEIRKCLDHDISWHNQPKGGYTVNFDKPLKVTQEKLPEIKIIVD
jgi:hypothetical protein